MTRRKRVTARPGQPVQRLQTFQPGDPLPDLVLLLADGLQKGIAAGTVGPCPHLNPAERSFWSDVDPHVVECAMCHIARSATTDPARRPPCWACGRETDEHLVVEIAHDHLAMTAHFCDDCWASKATS